MLILTSIASIVMILLIFTFFGGVYSGVTPNPNMFNLMFGTTSIYTEGSNVYLIQRNSFPGMTTLFAFEILIIIVSVALIIFNIFSYRRKQITQINISLSAGLAVLSLIAAIISFCSMNITFGGQYNYAIELGARLGLGPILYSTFALCAVWLILCGGIHEVATNGIYVLRAKKRFAKVTHHKSASSNNENISSLDGKTNHKTNELTEKEVLDLLVKYKDLLDSGVITEEEYENKKKELLSKTEKVN